MSTEAITLEVDADAATAFRSASVEERKKFVAFVSFLMKEFGKGPSPSLQETMDEISRNARAKGLTPEILNSILQEE